MGYMKIENLYRFNDIMEFRHCFALEKVHGTSAHIQWSKGHVSFYSGGEKHDKFVELFDQQALEEFFRSREYPEDLVIRIHGEAYGGKQQGMSKTYGPKLHFIAFDVRIGDNWLDVPKAESFCLQAGIEFIPFAIIDTTEEELNKHRDWESIVAIRRGMGKGHIREGIVIRPPFEVKLNSGARLIAKHKRDEFRETKSPRLEISPEKQKILDDAQEIADEWCVPMRLRHVIDKMTINGKEPDIKDLGNIIQNMIADVYIEGKGEFTEGREVQKAIGHKTVTLFKEYLRQKTFKEE